MSFNEVDVAFALLAEAPGQLVALLPRHFEPEVLAG